MNGIGLNNTLDDIFNYGTKAVDLINKVNQNTGTTPGPYVTPTTAYNPALQPTTTPTPTPPSTGIGTTGKVLLGVGAVGIIGGLVYAVTRKKKKKG